MGWLKPLEFTGQTTRDKRATQRENYRPAGSHTREIPLSNDQLKCVKELPAAGKRTTEKD